MKKKILITGNEGFIGSHLTPYLKRSYKVIGWDLKSGRDIFDNEFETAVKNADIVIHLAALTSVEKSFKNPEEVTRVNVLGTARVCEFVVKWKKRLIMASSASIYHRELSPYAESKALADDICKSLLNYYPITILRFFNVFGVGMNPESGSVMYEFAKGVKKGKIIIFGDGEQNRDFVHVNDLVKVIKASIGKKWEGKIVDVGLGQAFTINYIAGLFGHFGKAKLVYLPPKREIKWSIANTRMLETLYGKFLHTDMEKAIKEIVTKGLQ